MWSALPRELCLGDPVALQKYEHILIDEAQFFAPSWFELVKLSEEERLVADIDATVDGYPTPAALKVGVVREQVGQSGETIGGSHSGNPQGGSIDESPQRERLDDPQHQADD